MQGVIKASLGSQCQWTPLTPGTFSVHHKHAETNSWLSPGGHLWRTNRPAPGDMIPTAADVKLQYIVLSPAASHHDHLPARPIYMHDDMQQVSTEPTAREYVPLIKRFGRDLCISSVSFVTHLGSAFETPAFEQVTLYLKNTQGQYLCLTALL